MDLASLIGCIIGIGCLLFVGYHSCHGHWAMFFSEEGVFTVFGGSLSVAFMALPMSSIKNAGGWMRRFFFHKGRSTLEAAKVIGELADKARREGVLALESDYSKIKEVDPFLAAGMRMTIDGMDPGAVEATLRLEIMAMQERHKAGKKFFDLIKLYGPGWGLVGTLVGQIGMFGNLSSGDIGMMGHMLALAVVATMYGTILANAVAGPMGDKLAARSTEEMLSREMVLQGILSIMSGDNPRITVEKMMAFVPMGVRAKLAKAA
jgi:chemotaxis protein MotA